MASSLNVQGCRLRPRRQDLCPPSQFVLVPSGASSIGDRINVKPLRLLGGDNVLESDVGRDSPTDRTNSQLKAFCEVRVRARGGGSIRLEKNGEQLLSLGDTLDIGFSDGKDFRCRQSLTLELASSATAGTYTGGARDATRLFLSSTSKPSGVNSSRKMPESSSSSSSFARETVASSSRKSGKEGPESGSKRRLVGAFGDSRFKSSRRGSDGGQRSPITIEDEGDDIAVTTVTPRAAASAESKRRRRERSHSGKIGRLFQSMKVVDLSGAVGTSCDQPLDLCDSDDEGTSGEPPAASGARTALTASGDANSANAPSVLHSTDYVAKRRCSSVSRSDDALEPSRVPTCINAPGTSASEPVAPARALIPMHDQLRLALRPTIRGSPEMTSSVIDEALSCGMSPPGSLCELVVTSLLKSRCKVRNECLRRQLHIMLDVDQDCWKPPGDDCAPKFLESVMLGVTSRGVLSSSKRHDCPTSYSALEAHLTVLEVVLRYLGAGRQRQHHRRRDSTPLSGDKSPAERVMQFFAIEKKKKRYGKAKKLTPTERALNAVEASAAWVVQVWGWTVTEGSEAEAGTSKYRHPRRRREMATLAQARLLTANLLAVVVEKCGLPATTACKVILRQMGLTSGILADAGAAAGEERDLGRGELAAADAAAGAAVSKAEHKTSRILGLTARGALVRALLGRPFCAELARVLLDDIDNASDDASGGDAGEAVRLRALLSRVLRRAGGGSSFLL